MGQWTASLSSKEARSNSLVNWYYRRARQSLRQFRVRKSILRIHRSTAIVRVFVVLTASSRSAVCRRRECGCRSSERVELRVSDVVTVYKRWFSIRTKCMAWPFSPTQAFTVSEPVIPFPSTVLNRRWLSTMRSWVLLLILRPRRFPDDILFSCWVLAVINIPLFASFTGTDSGYVFICFVLHADSVDADTIAWTRLRLAMCTDVPSWIFSELDVASYPYVGQLWVR